MQVSLSLERSLSNDVAIMVDVLRASTTITVALENIPLIIPVQEIDEAFSISSQQQTLLAGERGGATVEGFDAGNSPIEIQKLSGRTLILTTSNGTRILQGIEGIPLVGSFVNARAVAEKALELAETHVDVVMAGVNGNFAIEDFLGAGEVISYLYHQGLRGIAETAEDEETTKKHDKSINSIELDEMAQAACLAVQNRALVDETVKKSRSASGLKKLGFEADIDFCLQRNISTLVPVFEDGVIKVLK